MIHYISKSVLWKKLDYCIQVQGHSKGSECQCLSRWYLLKAEHFVTKLCVVNVMHHHETECHARSRSKWSFKTLLNLCLSPAWSSWHWSPCWRLWRLCQDTQLNVPKRRLVIVLPPMLTVPSWSSKVSVMILSRNMLKRVGESRHPCRTPTVVRNQSPMLLLKMTALCADVVLLHGCPQSCIPNPVEGLLEVYVDIVQVLLVLEIFLT